MRRAIHDISLRIDADLPVWPGDPEPSIRLIASQSSGDEANVTEISMSAHTGTHVDAPAHYLPGGATVDELDLNVLVGPAWVACALNVDTITAGVLDELSIPSGTTRLLLRTQNSAAWGHTPVPFDPDFVALSPGGARWLVEHGVLLVGIDALSIAVCDQTTSTHVILLEAGVIPLEGLNLSGIAPGPYELLCLPLCVADADGAPARAILIETE